MAQTALRENQLLEITEVSLEQAYEIAATMPSAKQTEINPLTIYSGDCVEFGSIHIVIFPIGNPVLLPFASLNAS